MGGRLSPLLIVFLLIVVVVMGLFVFHVLQNQPQSGPNGVSEYENPEPTLVLSQELSEDESKVVISITASVEDELGIEKIILPDGSEVAGDAATYEVEENNKYKFTAVAVNGKSYSKSATVEDIKEVSFREPYVPDGFTVISANIEKGYVISDKFGNQYVWVPVENGQLTRETQFDPSYDDNASDLANSVGQYYGFYVARFEASQYETNDGYAAASMGGKVPWVNITFPEANTAANEAANAFGYTNCYTSLINSYAWDTILKWLDKDVQNFSSSLDYGNYGSQVYLTGTTQMDNVKNICDISGNVKEWTTEMDTTAKKDKVNVLYRIVRGGCANLPTTPASRKGYPEDNVNEYWGFRTILYK